MPDKCRPPTSRSLAETARSAQKALNHAQAVLAAHRAEIQRQTGQKQEPEKVEEVEAKLEAAKKLGDDDRTPPKPLSPPNEQSFLTCAEAFPDEFKRSPDSAGPAFACSECGFEFTSEMTRDFYQDQICGKKPKTEDKAEKELTTKQE